MRVTPRVVTIMIATVALIVGGSSFSVGSPSEGTDEQNASSVRDERPVRDDLAQDEAMPRSCIDPSGNPFPCHNPKSWAKKQVKRFKKGKLGHVKRFPLKRLKHPRKLKKRLIRKFRKYYRAYEHRTGTLPPGIKKAWLSPDWKPPENKSGGNRFYSCAGPLRSLCHMSCSYTGRIPGIGSNTCKKITRRTVHDISIGCGGIAVFLGVSGGVQAGLGAAITCPWMYGVTHSEFRPSDGVTFRHAEYHYLSRSD